MLPKDTNDKDFLHTDSGAPIQSTSLEQACNGGGVSQDQKVVELTVDCVKERSEEMLLILFLVMSFYFASS